MQPLALALAWSASLAAATSLQQLVDQQQQQPLQQQAGSPAGSDLPPARSQGRNCRERHGVAEVRSIGLDCEVIPAAAAGEPSKVEFPMKTISLDFPCAEPFATPPLVMITIMHEDTNKLYASSVRNVTKHGFSFNLQRVDDVAEPDMRCSQLRVSYIATSDFISNDI